MRIGRGELDSVVGVRHPNVRHVPLRRMDEFACELVQCILLSLPRVHDVVCSHAWVVAHRMSPGWDLWILRRIKPQASGVAPEEALLPLSFPHGACPNYRRWPKSKHVGRVPTGLCQVHPAI